MKAQTLRQIRRWHLYLGVFFTPAILLFSISGGLQTYRLQDEDNPPYWITWIASLHKDQRLPQVKVPEPKHDVAAPAESPPKPKPVPLSRRILQLFTALLAAGLSFSAILGVMIALNTKSTRNISLVMLALGTVLPLAAAYI